MNAEGIPEDAERVAEEEGLADFDPSDAFDASDDDPTKSLSPRRFLTDLGDVLRAAGHQVQEVDGWQQRARRSGGYPGAPAAIIIHHTASKKPWDGDRDVKFLTFDCDAAPLANLYLDRGGQWWVLAAGATNTNGKGGPLGSIPADKANSRVIGIEAGNDGVGEPWPEVMQDAYLSGVAALADAYGVATNHVFAHHEWAPGRKIDPAGPNRFGTVGRNQSWDMNAFREQLQQKRGQAAAPEAATVTTTPDASHASTYVVQPGDSWWRIAEQTMGNPGANWTVLADANGGRDRKLLAGNVLTIPGG
jgi:LysM repeat protein